MDILKILFVMTTGLSLCGCQIGYYLHTAKGQLSLVTSRVPAEDALQDPKIAEQEKQKIRLAQSVREFAVKKLGLKENKNYTDYISLDRPYVTYVISAAEKMKLKAHEWDFLFVGKMPYKGFFDEAKAKEEEQNLIQQGYDTYLRGVSAYSTLGWFRDPLLSSMTHYRDDVLVDTLIHETVHLTLYIKGSADFNERLAVFFASKGTEEYYRQLEGEDSPTIKKIHLENQDEAVFSKFISAELKQLEKWYQENNVDEEKKNLRIKEIQKKFESDILPQLKTKTYTYFKDAKLNNARLLVYKTYVADLSDFEKLFDQLDHNYEKFLETCKTLEKDPHPEEGLKKLISH